MTNFPNLATFSMSPRATASLRQLLTLRPGLLWAPVSHLGSLEHLHFFTHSKNAVTSRLWQGNTKQPPNSCDKWSDQSHGRMIYISAHFPVSSVGDPETDFCGCFCNSHYTSCLHAQVSLYALIRLARIFTRNATEMRGETSPNSPNLSMCGQ